MEWTQVKVFQTPAHDFDKEAELIGKYIEAKKVNTENGEQTQYIFENESGETVMVWGSFKINQFMSEIAPDTNVKIVFTGRQDIGNGKTVKNFEVFTA